MLNNGQIEQFKKEGILIIKGFFSDYEIETWKNEVLLYFGNPVSEKDWVGALLRTKSSQFSLQHEPLPSMHPKMKKLYECLSKSINWEGENEIVVRAPEIEAEWLGARTPHLDFPVYDSIRTLANSVFYLSDVSTFAAPFMYWPGSHIVSWNYFKENPKDYMAQGNLSQDMLFAEIKKRVQNDAVAFEGKAGDLMIWHSLLLHSASVNKSSSARLALIGRWGSHLNSNELHFDFNKDIWDYLSLNPSN